MALISDFLGSIGSLILGNVESQKPSSPSSTQIATITAQALSPKDKDTTMSKQLPSRSLSPIFPELDLSDLEIQETENVTKLTNEETCTSPTPMPTIKKMKKLTFGKKHITRIPTRQEYITADLAKQLWWNANELDDFKTDAVNDLKSFTTSNKCDLKTAMRILYQPESSSS